MKKIIYPLLFISLCKIASAQKDSLAIKDLDPVVVTATKSNLKQSQTGKIVTVLDQKIIRNSAGKSLSELLNTQAGFFINGANNTSGTNLDVYFRGASSGDMLIVVDGIPVYDPSQTDNSFDLNSIPLEQVERIEILRGGQSTLWGSDAVAGVIQIFLKKETPKKFAADALVGYGSYRTLHSSAGFNGSCNKLVYTIRYNYIKSSGFSSAYDSSARGNFDNDGFEQHDVNATLTYKIGDKVLAKVFNNFNFYHNDLDEAAFTDDQDYTARNKNNLTGLLFAFRKKGVSWNFLTSNQKASRTYLDDSFFISSPFSKYSHGSFTGNTFAVETYGTISLAEHMSVISGIQYLHQNTQQSYLSINNVTPPYNPYDIYSTALGKDSAAINQQSIYASLLITNLHHFNFEIGGRINHHSIYGTNTTYTINPSYSIDQSLRFCLNISTSYKIPSLYQLYSEYGNKDLRPETGATFEAAIQTKTLHNKLNFRLGAFKRDIRNLIVFYTDTITYASEYINRDRQNDYGFEMESDVAITKLLNWSTNVSFVTGKGIEGKAKVDNLYRRPKVIFNTAFTLEPTETLTITTSFKYVGSRMKSPYDAGPEKLPAYYTIDFSIAYDLVKKVRLFADVHNITAQRYYDIPGYNSKLLNGVGGIMLKL